MPGCDVAAVGGEPTRVLFWHPKLELHRFEHAFLPRLAFCVYPSAEALVDAAETAGAAGLLLADPLMPRTLLARLGLVLQQPGREATRVVFVTSRAASPSMVSRAALLPRSQLVGGGARFIPRLLEAIATACGCQPRVHLRRDTCWPGTFRDLASPLVSHAIVLENLSESGARLSSVAPAAPGALGELCFTTDGQQVSLSVEIVRAYLDRADGRWRFGARFRELPGEQASALRELLGTDAKKIEPRPAAEQSDSSEQRVRRAPRLLLPPKLTVKARVEPTGSTRRMFFTVLDVSSFGFRCRSTFGDGLEAGQQAEALLTWKGDSFSCLIEVVHKRGMAEGKRPSWEYGSRFLTVSAYARKKLNRLLHQVGETGLAVPSAH